MIKIIIIPLAIFAIIFAGTNAYTWFNVHNDTNFRKTERLLQSLTAKDDSPTTTEAKNVLENGGFKCGKIQQYFSVCHYSLFLPTGLPMGAVDYTWVVLLQQEIGYDRASLTIMTHERYD